MKAYTDLEQSRKLAEFLPVESADMSYRAYREEGGIPDYQVTLCPYQFASWIGIPCWSLAALLDVLRFPTLRYDIEDGEGGWIVSCEKDDKWYLSYYRDNPVDACYEMILKLHEQKLL